MSTSHSPGPWEVSDTPDERTGQYVIQQPDTAHIGQIATVWGRNNARLVGAAPELLEACKLFMHEWRTMRHDFEGTPQERIANLASAAIAKAEGREA